MVYKNNQKETLTILITLVYIFVHCDSKKLTSLKLTATTTVAANNTCLTWKKTSICAVTCAIYFKNHYAKNRRYKSAASTS